MIPGSLLEQRFILLDPNKKSPKKPLEKGWQEDANYDYHMFMKIIMEQKLIKYGIVCGKNDLCCS